MREHIALTVDGAAILLIAMGLLAIAYQRSKTGLALGVAGAVIVSATTTLRAYPVPTRAALEEQVEGLKAQVGDLDGQVKNAQKRGRAAEEQAIQWRTKFEAEHGTRTELEEKLPVLEGRVAAEGEVRRLAEKGRESARSVLSMFSSGLSTELFDLEVLPDRELVSGKIGFYLLARIKDPENGPALIFPKGEFVSFADSIRKATDQIHSKVIEPVRREGMAVEVFIRGGATVEKWAGSDGVGSKFGEISFRRLEGSKYGQLSSPVLFPSRPTNDDLPLLRAAFARSVAAPVFLSAELLHKQPSASSDERERTIDVVLYVTRKE
jgi:hypothetical protein